MADKRITVLVSGRGSNLLALLRASGAGALGGAVVHVVSNNAEAPALEIARAHGIKTTLVDHRNFATRDDFDHALQDAVDVDSPELVVLAGFMRLLGVPFATHFAGRLINVHPSLLPAYPGLRTHRHVLADGVRIHGCTVHFVTAALDTGPIVAQGAVAVRPDDDETTLAARVLDIEHALLPAVVRWYCAGRLVIADGRVRVMQAPPWTADALLSPPPF